MVSKFLSVMYQTKKQYGLNNRYVSNIVIGANKKGRCLSRVINLNDGFDTCKNVV